MALGDTLGAAIFTFTLVCSILPSYTLSVIGLFVQKLIPGAMKEGYIKTMNNIVTFTCILGWRFTLAMCWWIKIMPNDLSAYQTAPMGSSGRPCVIVSNHTSFLDIITLSSFLPWSRMPIIRTLASNHIFKMPVLGLIQYAAGTVKVAFKSQTSFEVDRDLMATKLLEIERYLGNGNWLIYFPEGTINGGDTSQLQTFRAGGFRPYVHVDAELWCVAHQGLARSWPKASMLGGRPTRVGIATACLCESTHKFLAGADLPADADDGAKAMHLANCAQNLIQQEIGAMKLS